MNLSENKRLKQIAGIIAIVVAIIALQFGISKYVLTREDSTELSFFEYRIQPSEIVISPETYTGEEVEVTITASRPGLSVEYQVGDGEWTPYTGPFSVNDNLKINTRYVSTEDEFVGPVTDKDVTNIAVARITKDGSSTYYKTLAEAIAACPADAGSTQTTIEMLANTTENVTVPAGKNIILDLAGNTVTSEADGTIVVNGTFNLINTNGEGTGEIKSTAGSAIKVGSTGSFIMGTNEDTPNVSTTNPVVTGESYGVDVAENGQFSFYDGKIYGDTNAINGSVTNTPTKYEVVTNESGKYEVATLQVQITVTFDADGGTVSPTTKTVLEGKTYGELPTASKTGYIFDGWEDESHQSITELTIVTQKVDHTLTALYTPITYTITYNSNTGAGEINPTTCTYDTEATIAQNTFTKTGYTFKEWNTAANGTGTAYTAGAKVTNLTTTNNDTITLYAIWEDKTAPTDTAPTGTSTTNTITVQCNQTDDGTGIDNTTIQYAISSDGGTTWSEWQSSATFENLTANKEYTVKTKASDIAGNGPTESKTAKISTANIENGTIELHENTSEGTAIPLNTSSTSDENQINDNIYIDLTPSTTGTTTVEIKKPDDSTQTISDDSTIETVTGKYEITVKTTDGTNEVSDTYYVFVDKTLPTVAPESSATTNSITVDAKASDANSGIDTITYVLKDDQGSTVETITKTSTDENKEVTFTGLTDGKDYTVEITVTDKAGNTTTSTVNESTDELVVGSLAFKEHTSSTAFAPANTEPAAQNKIWVNEDVDITKTNGSAGTTTYTVQKVGGTSTEYSANSEIATTDGDYVVTLTTTDGTNTKTVTYYFSVDKTLPTVTINPNTAELTIAVGYNTANVATTLTATDNENGSGVAVTKYAWSTSNTEEPSAWSDFTSGTEVTATKEGGVYYVWTKIQDAAGNEATVVKTSGAFDVGYAVEYDVNGGQGTISNQRKVAGTKLTLTDVQPTKEGYLFKGWSTTPTGTVEYASSSIYSAEASVKLYAVWSEVVASTTINGVTTNYDTVQGAINAAGTSEATVTLLKNSITEAVTVAAGQNITLDTNGKTLSGSSALITNYGNLTITGNGTIYASNNYAIENNLDGEITLNNSTITGGGIRNNGDGIVTINGGTVNTTKSHAIRNYTGNIEVNGGTIKTVSSLDAIWTSSSGNVLVTGGEITGGTNGVVCTNSSNSITITGGTIISTNGNAVQTSGTLTIGKNNDTTVASTSSPVIIGSITGVYSSSFNFYDGIIKVPEGNRLIKNGATINTPTGYRVVNGKETIEGAAYDTAYLDNTYYVTFNDNCTDGQTTKISKTYNNTLGELPTPKTSKQGYTFAGWFTEQTAGTQVTSATKVTADATYYAHWTPNTNTPYVVYHYLENANDANYSLVLTDNLQGTTDASLTLANLSKAGTTTAPDSALAKTAITENGESVATTTIAPDGSTKVYIYYTRNTHTLLVTDGSDITSVTGSGTYKWGQTVNISAVVDSVPGYVYTNFAWDTTDGSIISNNNVTTETVVSDYSTTPNTTVANASAASATVTMPSSNTTISATVTKAPITYTLGFDKNGGIAEVENHTTYTVNDSLTLNPVAKQGYVFAGWKLSTLNGQPVENGEVITSIPAGTTGNRTYVAQWNNGEVSYKVYHMVENANDSNYSQYSVETIDTYKGTETKVKTGDVITLDNNLAIQIANANYEKSTTTIGGDQGTNVTVAADSSTEIYVYYKRATYTLTVNKGNYVGTVKINGTQTNTKTTKVGETVTLNSAYENLNGYTYSNLRWETTDGTILSVATGDETVVTMPAANTTVTAVADRTINTYTISYTLNDGTVSGTNPVSYTVEDNNITLINPTKTGYTFDGWSGTGITGMSKNVVIPTGSYGNRAYTANWTVQKYTVTFDANEGTVNPTSKTVTYGEAYGTLPTPTRTGYTFEGWKYGNSTITAQTTVSATADHTLKAEWTANKYTVTFNANGGTVTPTSKQVTYDETFGELPTPTREGYTFAGWEDANGNVYTDSTKVQITEDTELKAKWNINSYNVTYDYGKNGGQKSSTDTSKTSTQSADYNTAIDLTKTAYKAGYNFVGWNTSSSASTALQSLTMQTADVTLYAIYSRIVATPETVTLDLSSDKTTQQITVSGDNYGTVTYESSNPAVATVSDTGLITAVSNGTATITVKGTNGSTINTDTVEVTVRTSPTSITLNNNSALIGVENGYNTVAFTETVLPATANYQNNITWSSNNSNVATVSNGTVTGVADGVTTISATTGNGLVATAEVTVDGTAPVVSVSMDNNNYAKQHTATITLTDATAGLPASQTINYAWSTSSTDAPTSWSTATISTTAGTKSASTTVTTPASKTGTYYLWVKAGVEDRFENATSANYINKSAEAKLDNTKPVIAINGTSSPANASPSSTITVPLKVTETNAGIATDSSAAAFTADDITVKVNGTVVNPTTKTLTYGTTSSGVYSYTLTLEGVEGTGALTLEVAAGKVTDNAQNSNNATTINTGVTMDAEAFSCTITANTASPTNASEIIYTFTFNKPTSDFTIDDIDVTNGTKGAFSGSGTTYTLVVTNNGTCTQTVGVKEDSCKDASGNTVDDVQPLTISIDRTAPTAPQVTVKAETATGTTKGTVAAGNSGTVYTGATNNYLIFSATDDNAEGAGKGTVVSYEVSESANFATKTVVPAGDAYNFTATTDGKVYYVRTIDNVGNTSAITTVTVKKVTLAVDPTEADLENEKTLAITATGENAGTITWSSSDETIATVSSTGVVTAKKVGTVTITATASTDTSVKAQSNVNITKGIVEIPTAVSGLVYDAQNKTGVVEGTKYTITNNTATDAGNYTATASLKDSTNYQWSDGTTTNKSISWKIAQKPVTVTATASNKVYDGTTNVVNGSLSVNGVEVDDRGDAKVAASGTFAYGTATVGNNKTINVTGITLTGTRASNYVLSSNTATTKANITAKELTVTYAGETITYGETPDLAITITGFASGETSSVLTTQPTISTTETNVGEYTVTPVAGTATNYTFNCVGGTLKIVAKPLTDSDLTATIPQNKFTYSGKDIKPEVTVKDNGKTLVEGTDYTVAYSADTKNVGTKTITITGKGNYSGTKTLTYTIDKATLTATYAGEVIEYGETPALELTVTGFVNGETSATAAGYTAPTITATSTTQGSYSLTPTGGSATNYDFNYVSGTLIINAKSNVRAVLSQDEYTYDGKAKTPTVTVFDDAKILELGTDYTVAYTNNTDAGTATVTITLQGNYSGTKTLTFTINKAQGTGTLGITGWTYGDTANAPVATSTSNPEVTYQYTGKTNAGATYSSTTAPTQAGNYTVTATFAESDNYLGFTRTADFTISRATLTPSATANNKDYDGTTDATGTITLTGAKYSDVPTATGTFEFTSSSSNSETAQVVNVTDITLGNSWTANYTLSTDTLETSAKINMINGTATVAVADYTYGDTASTPVPTSTTNGTSNVTYSYSGTTNGGATYGPSDVAPTQAGTYTVTATFAATADYKEVVVTDDFVVNKRKLTVTASAQNRAYNGGKNASGSITLGNAVNGETPTASATFAFVDGNAGTNKTVNVTSIKLNNATAQNNYANNYELDKTSTTTTANINKVALTATYAGETIPYGTTPALAVTVTGFVNSETAGTAAGYTAPKVTAKNTSAGTYTLTPAGGAATNYSFNYVAGDLVITPISVSDLTITLAENTYTYDGTAKTPAVTVKNGSKTLVLGTDYTVEYTNNTNAGTASVVIKGAGNYSGTKTLTFTINKVSLTPTATVNSKAYDGTTAATGTVSIPAGVNNETPTLKSGNTFRFSNKNAGTGKTVYVENIELDDIWKTNYQLTASTLTLTNGSVNKVELTAKFDMGEDVLIYGETKDLNQYIEVTGFITGEGATASTGVTKADGYVAPTVTNTHTEVGTYTLTPAGGAATNYSFKYVGGTLNIVKKQANVTITLNPTSYDYDGTEKEPAVTVVDNSTGAALTAGTDYTVEYADNVNAGTAKVTVKLCGNFDGEKTKTFDINKIDMAGSVSIAGWTYGETAKVPTTTVTTGTVNNYTVTYSYSGTTNAGVTYGPSSSAPTEAGTYTVTATIVDSEGNHNDLVETANFTIAKKSVVPPTITTGLKYTGAIQTGVPTGSNYSITGNTATNAGNYEATATLSNTNNYEWSDKTTAAKTYNWAIGKVTLVPSATANDKVYDGTATATAKNAITLTGAVNSEKPTATATAYTFVNANDVADSSAEVNKKVKVTGIALGTAWTTNYELSTTEVSTTATISKKAMTVAGVTSYTGSYDGNAHGVTVNVTEPSTAGTDYEIYYSTTGALTSANYATAGSKTAPTRTNAGTTTVYYYVKDLTGNYSDYASNANSNNGTITVNKVQLTPSISSVTSKVYDGNQSTTGSIALSGAITGETPTATATFTFDNKNVGTGKTVTASNIALTGSWGTNYTLKSTTATSNNGEITPKTVTATLTANDKSYDGNTTATGSLSLSGVVSGDTVTASATSYTFNSKDAGTRTVTAKTIALSGKDSGNYTLSSTTATDSATISKVTLTPSVTANNKVYDGLTSGTGSVTLTGAVNSEAPTATATFTFADKNVGTDIIVDVTDITLGTSWTTNYELSTTTGSSTADISKATLNAKFNGKTVTFSGTAVNVNSAIAVTGFVNGETAATADGYKAPTINNTNTAVGTYTLTPAGGAATNYKFTYTSGKLIITPNTSGATITVSPDSYVYTGSEIIPTSVVVKAGDTTLTEGTDYDITYTDNVNVGTATATATLKGNYSGTTSATYQITKANGTGSVTMAGWTYGGTATSPVPTSSTNGTDNVTYQYFTDSECKTKTSTSDGATVAGGKPTKAGTYYVKATFGETANYNAVTATASFTIAKATLTPTATVETSKVYDKTTTGSGTVTLTGAKNSEVPTVTSTFTYDNANVGTGKTVTVGLTLDSAWTRNYELSTNTIELTNGKITPKVLTATLDAQDKVYDGNTTAQGTITLTGVISGDTVTVSAANKAFNSAAVGTRTVTASGLTLAGTSASNYSLAATSVTDTASITKKAITDSTVTASLATTSYTYDGTAKTPTVTISDSKATITSSDYTVTYSNNTNAGTATVTITATANGNYSGSRTLTFDIAKADMSVNVANYSGTYDGSAHGITLTTDPSTDIVIYYSTTTPLTSANFITGTTTAPTRTDAGTTNVYYYIVDLNNNYNAYASNANSNNGTITITAKALTSSGITATLDTTTYTYDKTAKTPTVTVKDGTKTLVKDTDYTVTYSNNINAGTATVTITGKGNYSGTITKTFTINKKSVTPVLIAQDKEYDGTTSANGSISLTGVVSGDTVTASATSIKFADANVGTDKTVTASGITIAGTSAANYKVNATATTTADITPATLTATYAGETITYGSTPSLTVSVTGFKNGETAGTAAGYTAPTVTASSLNVGTYTLTPAGGAATNYVFNYVSGTLAINANSNVEVAVSPTSYTYDGTAKTPTVTVTDKSTGATIASSAYTVSYSNNTNAGTATATITFKEGQNYSGTYSKNFTIAKANRTISVSEANVAVGIGATKDVTFTYTGTEDATLTSSNITTTSDYVSKTYADGSKSGTITFTGVSAGSDVVTITLPASTNYNSATKTFNISATQLTLDKSNEIINKGNQLTITPTMSPTLSESYDSSYKTVQWSSSDTSVATVSSATTAAGTAVTVTGVGEGTATISATLNGQTVTATVQVVANYAEYNGDTLVKYYGTLQEAVTGATSGNTIVTLQDRTEETATVPSGKTLTLDLNGKTITAKTAEIINNAGNLTILDSSSSEEGKLYSKRGSNYVIVSSGNLTIENGTYQNAATYSGYGINITSGDLTINNGDFSASYYTIRNSGTGTVTINDGSFESTSATVSSLSCITNDGNININGGTIRANGGYALSTYTGVANITGGTFVSSNNNGINCSSGTINIGTNDGTVSTTVPSITGKTNGVSRGTNATINFYDGVIIGQSGAGSAINGTVRNTPIGYGVNKTLAGDVETAILIPNIYEEITSDGTHVNYYDLLSDAFAKSTSGNTIRPLVNVQEPRRGNAAAAVPPGKVLTFDLNGKTITSNSYSISNVGTLTIKGNGTLNKFSIANLATMSMDDTTLYGSITNVFQQGLTEQGHTLTISDSTINGSVKNNGNTAVIISDSTINKENNSYALNNDQNATATLTNLVINADSNGLWNHGTVVINNGTFNVQSSRAIWNQEGTVTINGGTYTGNYEAVANRGTLYFNDGEIKPYSDKLHMAISNGGDVYINGGIIRARDTQSTHAINSSGGNITITDGQIYSECFGVNYATGLSLQNTNLSMSGGTIDAYQSNANAQYNATGIEGDGSTVVNITGGSINARKESDNRSAFGINYGGNVTIGTNDGTVGTTSPEIKGDTNGIRGGFSFYDGVIIGQSGAGSAITDSVTATPTGYGVSKTVANGVETAILIPANYKEYQGTTTTFVNSYTTLADAMANVANNNTIKPVFSGTSRTETAAVTLASGKTAILDLNGKTINMGSYKLTNKGTLTVRGTSGTIKGSSSTIQNYGTLTKEGNSKIQATSNNAVYNYGGGTFIMNGGTVETTPTTLSSNGYVINNSGDFTFNAGTINATSASTGGQYQRGIYLNAAGNITIEGGTLNASGSGLQLGSSATGTVTINNGTINTGSSTASTAIISTGSALIKINGGNINSQYNGVSNGASGTLEITGGTITTSVTGIVNMGILNYSAGTINATGVAISQPSAGTVNTVSNVSGGTITSTGDSAIHITIGSVNITGGNITAKRNGVAIVSNGTGTITGGTIESETRALTVDDGGICTVGSLSDPVNINNPQFIGTGSATDTGIGIHVTATGTLNFYSGIAKGVNNATIFTGTVNLRSGYTIANGTETVSGVNYKTAFLQGTLMMTAPKRSTALTSTKPAATSSGEQNNITVEIPKLVKISDQFYSSLEEAVSAASSGDTLTVLDNVSLTSVLEIASNKQITIDLNGKEITSTAINTISNRGNLTLTGSGIIRNEVTNGSVIYNAGTFKLDSGVITSSVDGAKGIYNESEATISGGKVVTEGIGSNAIYNSNNSKLAVNGGIIEVTGIANKGIYNNGELVINSTSNENIAKIVVSSDDSIGVYNSKDATKCDVNNAEVTISAKEIENYDLIKNTDEFKEELAQMKTSYGIYNDSDITVNIEKIVMKALRIKSVAILNNGKGSIVLGKLDAELNLATPIIYAIQDNTTAIVNNDENGKVEFYDGTICTLKSIKGIITDVLDDYEVYEEQGSSFISTILKKIETKAQDVQKVEKIEKETQSESENENIDATNEVTETKDSETETEPDKEQSQTETTEQVESEKTEKSEESNIEQTNTDETEVEITKPE